MRTLFYNLSTVNHYYLVGILYGGKTMRHYHYGTSFIKLVQIFHNLPFVLGIKGIGGFIQEDKIGIFINRSCYEDSLLLTLTETYSITTDFRIILQR